VQMLSIQHRPLAYILGKTSAAGGDKLQRLQSAVASSSAARTAGSPALLQFCGFHVLPGCHGYMRIEQMSAPVDTGDHHVVICKVTDFVGCSEKDKGSMPWWGPTESESTQIDTSVLFRNDWILSAEGLESLAI
jgi:hypothetical protein